MSRSVASSVVFRESLFGDPLAVSRNQAASILRRFHRAGAVCQQNVARRVYRCPVGFGLDWASLVVSLGHSALASDSRAQNEGKSS